MDRNNTLFLSLFIIKDEALFRRKNTKSLKQPKGLNTLDEIVFENRNKAYGAYQLRRRYAGHLLIGFLFALAFVFFLYSLPSIIKRVTAPEYPAVEIAVNLNEADTLEFLAQLPPPPPPPPPPAEENITKPEPVPVNIEPEVIEETIIKGDTSVAEKTPPDTAAITNTDSTLVADSLVNLPDSIPQFPGGPGWMKKFIKDNLQYPWAELEAGIEGSVVVGFLINKDGSIEDVEIKKGKSIFMNNEAERIISMMPKWLPAKRKGKPVKMGVIIEITFELPKK